MLREESSRNAEKSPAAGQGPRYVWNFLTDRWHLVAHLLAENWGFPPISEPPHAWCGETPKYGQDESESGHSCSILFKKKNVSSSNPIYIFTTSAQLITKHLVGTRPCAQGQIATILAGKNRSRQTLEQHHDETKTTTFKQKPGIQLIPLYWVFPKHCNRG